MSGKAGVALFPANGEHPEIPAASKNVKIDHFAFHVTKENFEKAKNKYEELGLNYNLQDHHYYHSIYTRDLDEHTLELTTLVVNEKGFYN